MKTTTHMKQKMFDLRSKGYSVRSIAEQLGYKSPRAVSYWLNKHKYLSPKVSDKATAFEHIHRIIHEETGFDYNISDALTYKILASLGYK